jgi:sugar (pentulose or hexulose) kinase
MNNRQKNILLSLDIGTQSVRALAFSKSGELIDFSRIEYHPAYLSDNPGWAEQDPEYYWQSLSLACRDLWKKGIVSSYSIAAVSITAQRATVVNLDESGFPLRPAILWLDQRRAEKVPKLGLFWRLIFGISRLRHIIDYFQAEAEINWIKEHQPDIWEKTEHYLLLSGYIHYKLTNLFKDSIACQVGFIPFNFKKQKWENNRDWKWEALSVKPETLPELVPPGKKLGIISNTASTATGIPSGTPVIAAASDKACEVLGAGCLKSHQGCIGYGTTATININSDTYFEPVTLVPAYPSAKPNAFNTEVQIFRGFWMVTWFKEQFAQYENGIALKNNISPESILEEQASKIPPGSLGLTLQPYWTPGIRFPGLEAKGSIIGFGADHKKEHLFRAILEGLAYGLREGREKIEKKSKTTIRELFVCGGGAKSDLVMQITADVFGLPAMRPNVTETSGLGAAILASVGSGVHPDLATAVKQMTRTGEVFTPNPKTVLVYDALYHKVYLRIYPKLKPLFHAIQKITGYPKVPGKN